jgi:DNA-binding HxlR family transcriptional regulator
MESPTNQHSEISLSYPQTLIAMFEDCIGCKWTIHLLAQIRCGITRPSALVKTKNGLTTKVLNECLVRLTQFGIIEKQSYPEIPPRVEYRLTPFGQEFAVILDQIEALHHRFRIDNGCSISESKIPLADKRKFR